MVLKLRHESKADYIAHILDMVAASQCLIAAAETKAKQFPALLDDCADVIAEEKALLTKYSKELEQAYALPDEEN